jgi:hypothetical protein
MTMSGVKKLKALSGAFIVLFLLNSCTDFFSTSWGEAFKRDPGKVKVTESNVYDLLEAAKGNPKLSKAILDKIGANSSDKLKHAAIQAANQASGITTLALENVQTLIDAAEKDNNEDALKDVANKVLDSATKNDLQGVSGQLVKILKDDVTTNSGKLGFEGNFIGNVSEADLTLMVMTLILAKAEKVQKEDQKDLNDYVDDLVKKNITSQNPTNLDDDEKLIAAAVNGMIERGENEGLNELTKMVKDLLGVD